MAESLVFTLLGIDKLSDKLEESAKNAKSLADRLDDFGKTGSKALGGVAGASLGAGVAVGGALAGITAAVGIAGAVLVSSNVEVAQSMTDLSNDALAAVRASAEPMTGSVMQATASIRGMVAQAQPALRSMFTSAGPQVVTLTGGINQLALNALPGMVTAVQSSRPAVAGMASLMASTGTATSQFFKIVSTGATSGGVALSSMGDIVRVVLPAAGSIVVQLADVWAANGGKIVNAVTSVIGVIQNVTSSGLPVMSTAIGIAADALNGLAIILEPLSGTLGTVAGVALSVGAAFKAVNASTGFLKGLDGPIAKLVTKMTEGGTAAGGFAGKVGSVVTALGGPLGIVMAGAVAGLALLGGAQQSAAEHARQHATYAQALAASLRDTNGVLDETTRKTVANDEAVKGAITAARTWGISSATVVDAVLGQGTALDQVKAKIQAFMAAHTEAGRYDPYSGGTVKAHLDEQGVAAEKFLNDLTGLNGKTKEAQDDQKNFGSSLLSTSSSMLSTTASGATLTRSMTVLKDIAADADSRARALKDALDALSGGNLSLEESQARVNSQLLGLKDLAGSSTDRTKGWGDALVDASGKINTMLPNGQALFGTMMSLRDSTAQTAQKTFDLSQSMGDTYAVSMDKARQATQNSRDAMIGAAMQMGISRDRANALADAMGLVPDKVETAISTPFMSDVQRELAVLKARAEAVPGSRTVTVSALTKEASDQLIAMGYQVEHTPNGVRITGNAQNAWDTLNGFLRTPATKTVGIFYQEIGRPYKNFGGPGRLASATGNLVVPMASGGISASTMVPMAAGSATFVRPNTQRLVGDRLDVPELYAPLDGSVRTVSLMNRAAALMGLGPAGGDGGALVVRAGDTWQVNLTAEFPNVRTGSQAAHDIREWLLELKRELGGGPLGFDT